MSTRSQVIVIQEGLDWEESITLYHHWDGYPSGIIPLLWLAYNYKRKPFYRGDKDTSCMWEKGRAGKAASLLCWAHPAGFEPECGHELHGDIEFYYRLYVVNSDPVRWDVEVLIPKRGFWDAPIEENLQVLYERQPLEDLYYKIVKEEEERMAGEE